MFKFAAFLRIDDITLSPFLSNEVCSFLRNGIIVITHKLFTMMNTMYSSDYLKGLVSKIIVIGSSSESNELCVYVKDIKECISYLSSHYPGLDWWVVGDNTLANDMITKGLIMDVYLAKNYSTVDTTEFDTFRLHSLIQKDKFNRSLLTSSEMGFSLISTTHEQFPCRSTRHYMRRNIEEQMLLSTMRDILSSGHRRSNRTGVDTLSTFGRQFEYKMAERIDPKTGRSSFRFPLLTTKRMFIRGVFGELKWFLHGGCNSKDLEKKGINIWKGNSSKEYLDSVGLPYEEGECGPIYGFQWRHFGANYIQGKTDYTGEGIDQVANVIESLQADPYGRRHIITGWAPHQIKEMALPPCHILYQFYVEEKDDQKYLSLMMTQRSADMFHGVPFNVASCSLFLLMMAHRVGMKPDRFIHNTGDSHIYENHIEAVNEQIQREPCMFPFVFINCDPKKHLEDYEFSEIKIESYYSHNAIKADMVA